VVLDAVGNFFKAYTALFFWVKNLTTYNHSFIASKSSAENHFQKDIGFFLN
jgi:hypothetical protein